MGVGMKSRVYMYLTDPYLAKLTTPASLTYRKLPHKLPYTLKVATVERLSASDNGMMLSLFLAHLPLLLELDNRTPQPREHQFNQTRRLL